MNTRMTIVSPLQDGPCAPAGSGLARTRRQNSAESRRRRRRHRGAQHSRLGRSRGSGSLPPGRQIKAQRLPAAGRGEARTLNTAEAGEAVQQDLEEREGLYPLSSVSGPRARGGKVSLVSRWFSMFSSDASAPEDEMVFKQVKRGSPLLLGGREGQFLQDSQQFSISAASPGCAYPTRQPPGHPCALLLLLELPTPSRGIMRPLMSWPCPLKSWQRDWRQRSPHFLSILCLQALLGVAFLLSPSEISRLLVGH